MRISDWSSDVCSSDLIFFDQVVANPKRVVFAEGEEETVIRAALEFRAAGYGTPVLIGRSERIEQTMKAIGLKNLDGCEIHNARLSEHNGEYNDFLYSQLGRPPCREEVCPYV